MKCKQFAKKLYDLYLNKEKTCTKKELLSTMVREIALELNYYQHSFDSTVEEYVIDMGTLFELAEQIDNLE